MKGKNESIIKRNFFERNPDIVAKELLGKKFIRKIGNKTLSGIIVETEAYFGENDPASRAYKRKSKLFHKKMSSKAGTLLIYVVHNNYLLNIISHKENEVGAVLIRAVEPIEGIEIMKKNRGKEKIEDLSSGPGKFTKCFCIDKKFDGIDITKSKNEIYILNTENKNFEIKSSKRIGVKTDLKRNLRFFISGNKFISK
ncbi:MAG TPA: DNA-3-methyladenine glycosylase [Candidatus Ratteibacteria bacterium]|nr:DNA-3-methyladenine glycosylase [Candidatus Ratteibacteria bacterium]